MKKQALKITRTNASGKYVNKETGHELSFNEGAFITTSLPTSMDTYSSKFFTYVDTDALSNLLKSELRAQEYGLIFIISSSLEFYTNICLNEEGIPFTTRSIASVSGYSQQHVKQLLNNLIKAGVLFKGKIKESKYPRKDVYVLNPHLIRRGRDFFKSIGKVFMDIAKPDTANNQSVLKTTFGEF